MKHIKDFRKLKVFQKARLFHLQINKVAKTFPHHEQDILKKQLPKATDSIAANLAEGTASPFLRKQFNYAANAFGSAREADYYLESAYNQNYISEAKYKEYDENIKEITKMLYGYMRTIKKEINKDA
ncbi:four helix bundle protein [Proteinivorax tanatarense]|uniref:Four helix bundle protein n=1 Tax=Proteinivorax tanatarense TaxID=1260629 RepID=A0AAU7VMF9_9FIRM